MNLESIKSKLNTASIIHSEAKILNKPSTVGYEKKFKWSWMATPLNTFVMATDFGYTEITKSIIEQHLAESFQFTKQNYTGWPRGFQSGLGVICILMSSNISDEAKDYFIKLRSGKKWAGITIPVVYYSETIESFQFSKNPMCGKIYYPHFKKLINNLK